MEEHIILEEQAIVEERSLELARMGTAITTKAIGDLPSLRPPTCVAPSASIREATETMKSQRVGCVLVEEKHRLVGVFTERDVLNRVTGQGLDLDRVKVSEVMTRDPECLTLDDGVAYALNKMNVGGFRHIPLVDDAGKPVGVVAMRNIVDYIVQLFPEEVLNLPPSPLHTISRAREGA
jgi:CBS domain-containing protein